MDKPAFLYTTYIKTTPEELWRALTEPVFTERYWGTTLVSDWQPGSTIAWHHAGVIMEDSEQVVLEADPPRRLAYTWHTITPEFVRAVGMSDEDRDAVVREPRSKVTFEIEPVGEAVRLTVVHDDFAPGGFIQAGVSAGWPRVMADLKSLLETGEPLPPDPARAAVDQRWEACQADGAPA